MKLNLIMINFYCLFYLPFDFWMHPITFSISSSTLQPHKRFLFLNRSIRVASWLIIHYTTFLALSSTHFRELSYLFLFFLECYGKSPRQLTSLRGPRVLPRFCMPEKKPFWGNPKSKEGKADWGQQWKQQFYISALINERKCCALCDRQYKKWIN